MEAYESTTAGSKFQTDVTTKSVHTWEEVLKEVNKASDDYNDLSGFWGKIRKGLRSFGKNNKAFEAWASVLPSQSHYFSLLCGGFKLIFGVCTGLTFPTPCRSLSGLRRLQRACTTFETTSATH